MILNPDYMITDAAYDALKAVYRQDRRVFEWASHKNGLRNLCRMHKIDPDA